MADNLLQSVENALKVLEVFTDECPEMGVSDISRNLGLGRSTVHRLLTTLEANNYVVQNPANNKYRLGFKIVNLGALVLRQTNIIKECRPYLEVLSRKTGESSHLAVYNRGESTFVDKVAGVNPAKMGSVIGAKLPAYVSATGKVMLANLPEAEQNEYLRDVKLVQYTPYTITKLVQLRELLEIVAQNGYAEDQQEAEEGLVCFAAPVRNGRGNVIAAISLSGGASRMNERRQELIAMVRETAEQASKACGWSPRSVFR